MLHFLVHLIQENGFSREVITTDLNNPISLAQKWMKCLIAKSNDEFV